MRITLFTIAALVTPLALGCSTGSGNGTDEQLGSGGSNAKRGYEKGTKPFVKRPPRTSGRHATATFAAGCFWCVEAIFEHVKGVDDAVSGYSGGAEADPSYKLVALGRTSHAESVQVHYDPDAVSYETLVSVLLGSMDPTQKDGQGPDHGRQYRSVIFFQNTDEKAAAERALAEEKKRHKKPLAVELVPLVKFWLAEDVHQDYEARNPNDPYIVGVSRPRLEKFKKKFPKLVRTH